MLPLVKIAELFGVNIKDNTGLNFKVSAGNVFFFFLFGLCSILIIWLAQKYIHKKKLSALGFKGRLWSPLLIGFIVGVILVSAQYMVLILNAGSVSYTNVIPPDVSFFSYLGYYIYFIVGFIFWNSFIEELGTRAYPIQTLKNYMNPHLIFTIMGILFAAGHFLLRDFNLGYCLSLFIFSYIFSLLYYYSESIWLPVGVHSGVNWVGFSFFGTNWKMGVLYSIEISNVPTWIIDYSSSIIYLVFLLLLVYLNKIGFFRKYFPKVTEVVSTES